VEVIYSDKGLIDKIVALADSTGARGRWLDMPSGGGVLARRLATSDREVIEVDREPAGDLPGRRILRLDMNKNLPFASRSFDGVACIFC